ncbi:MAG: hypothetical protein KA143_06320 [Saprospiraceae bacterium]|nr:hypothetical protein [Saprospiraceae bacterium]
MKTFFSILLMALLSTASIAKPEFELKSQGKSIIINPSGWSAPGYEIMIKDVHGQVVFIQDYFSPVKGNMVKLNVDQLPAGEYEIELADDFRIQKQTFSKNTERIWMKDDIQTIFKPIIKTEGAIIKVNFLNLDHSSSIEILDPSNRIIYSSEINQKQYSKQFNLSSVTPGEYYVHIVQGEHSYWTNVSIKE